jgi:hypothetical protein
MIGVLCKDEILFVRTTAWQSLIIDRDTSYTSSNMRPIFAGEPYFIPNSTVGSHKGFLLPENQPFWLIDGYKLPNAII